MILEIPEKEEKKEELALCRFLPLSQLWIDCIENLEFYHERSSGSTVS